MHFFIGHDSREQEAYDVCVHSLLRHATCPVKIHPLKHRQLRKLGLFWREWRMDGSGQWWDIEDGRPFSTEFAFTRFLTPILAKEAGVEDWAIFCDADFLFLDDVAKLGEQLDPSYAVMCVKHEYNPSGMSKMDGAIQTNYQRKNWSSLVAFNLKHPANEHLTIERVNGADGSWLHRFGWLADEQIGALAPGWNWLVGPMLVAPMALHYTAGGPWFEDWAGGPLDHIWLAERDIMKHPTTATSEKLLEAFA